MPAIVSSFMRDQQGATAIEYGLIAALIAVTAIAGMTVFGGGLTNLFGYVSERSANAMAAADSTSD
jgi:pilus assembly protein Flp/PilA